MYPSPKNKNKLNRISYFSMPNHQNQSKKIKTQPVDSPHFITKINFKNDSRLPLRTSYVDKNKSAHQIFMRKHKADQRHARYPSDLVLSQTNLTQRTQRQTQRQKFMKQLNSRVLRSQNSSIMEQQAQKQPHKEPITRYQKQLSISKIQKSRAKSNRSLSNLTDREIPKPRKQSCQISVVKIKSLHADSNDNNQLRERAKTFAKDFSKIVEENLNIKKKTCNSDQGKTIEDNNIEYMIQVSQSNATNQILVKKTAPPLNVARRQIVKTQLASKQLSQASAGEDSNRASYSCDKNNTQKFQEEVQQLTKEFLSDWDKMNATKTNLYQKFRNKLVKQYPNMRKKYKESQLMPPDSNQRSKKQSSGLITPGLQSSIKISFNTQNQSSEVNYLTVTQLKQETQRMQKNQERWKEQQRKTLKQIFKQAYFYSKTKGKCFSVKYQKTDEELEEQRKIRYIQKNMTFMKYINKKDSKMNITNGKKIKGENILRNKDSILQLQKEGSFKQHYLLKCLDDAIEDCLNK